MSNLLKLTQAVKPAAKNKSDRPVMPVPTTALQAFTRFAGADAVAKVVQARADVESAYVSDIMLEVFADTLFKTGTQPANPRLTVDKDGKPDIKGLFQVQTRFKFNIKEGDNPIKERLIDSLVDSGLSQQQATALVSAEVDTQPEVGIRPFSELVNGHYVGKTFIPATEAEIASAEKLMKLVMGEVVEPLTEIERDLVTYSKEVVKVKQGFFERLKSYCTTVDDIKAVLRVIQPVHFVSHIELGVNDTPDERVARLAAEAVSIIGVAA